MTDTRQSAAVSGPERRRYVRRSVIETQLLTADLLVKNAHERMQRGIVINVSEGGLAMQPFLPLTPGSGGELRVELPGCPQPFAAPGLVAWVGRGGRAGIRFVDLSSGARTLLRNWLLTPADPPNPNSLLANLSPGAPAERKPFEQLDFNSALELIAERARNITGASGAAVALGNSKGMVCRASIGSAPDVGAVLRPDAGLSGECLRTGKVVHCADMQSDPRVDPVAAARLNVRSVIIVPVLMHDELAGVVEVLSPRANGFGDRHLARLQHIADLLAATVVELRPRDSTAEEPYPLPAAAAKPPAAGPAPAPAEPAAAESLASSLLAAAERAVSPVPAERPQSTPATPPPAKPRGSDQAATPEVTGPPPCRSNTSRDKGGATPEAAAKQSPAAPTITPFAAAEPAPRLSLLERLQERTEAHRSTWIILAAIAVVLALVAVAGYLLYARAKAPAPAPVSEAAPPVSQPASPPPVAEPSHVMSVSEKKPALPAASAQRDQRLTMWPENRIRLPGPGSGMPEPPPISLGMNAGDGDVKVVVSSILVSDSHLRGEAAQARLSPGKLVHKVDPVYPDAAIGTGMAGDVLLTSRITKQGTVDNIKVISGPQLLSTAAAEAIRKWRYEPFMLDGKPVDVQTTMTVRFAAH